MRSALAARLKADYVVMEQRRSAEAAGNAFQELDDKLQKVEQLRMDKQRNELRETASLLEAEIQRQKEAASFARNIGQSLPQTMDDDSDDEI
jgi:hypothetical protein